MNEVDDYLILARQMLFAGCFSSTKELTISYSALEQKAKESRMMNKWVYSCCALQEKVRIT